MQPYKQKNGNSVRYSRQSYDRRSDDALRYDCTSDDGRKAFGSINSSIDAAKAGASVIFFDLGITDAITDKGRDYPTGFVIPLKKKQDS